MTKVKICGVTNVADAISAVEVGCDLIGLNFVPHSSRFLSFNKAEKIASEIASEVEIVAVFANASSSDVDRAIQEMPIDYVQFHGDEQADWCNQFSKPYIKAIPIEDMSENPANVQTFAEAFALLLDSRSEGQFGGTGKVFDWNLWPSKAESKLILAGGLSPNNVAEAIRICKPYAVDVASGVEKVKGKKDSQLMQKFMEEVRRIG
ncbi:MAG: phosphoribosylanthranilate isomerase [Gammaproteobacteria bacterium]|nr:phosphoribosylanthranilate isomerase [Gammaproteobacteria bacterium]